MLRTIDITGYLTGNGGNAGGTIVLTPPLGWKYHRIIWRLISGMCGIADISQLTHFLNTKIRQQLTGAQHDNLNQEDGITPYATNGILTCEYTLLNMRDVAPCYAPAINTLSVSKVTGKSVSSFRQEMLLGGAAAAAMFNIKAVVEPSTQEGPGVIMDKKVFTDALINGEATFTGLDGGTVMNALWRRLSVIGSAGATTDFRIIGKDAKELFHRTPVENTQLHLDQGIVDIAALGMVIDFAEDGVPNYLDTIAEMANAAKLEVKTTQNAAGVGTFILESLGEV